MPEGSILVTAVPFLLLVGYAIILFVDDRIETEKCKENALNIVQDFFNAVIDSYNYLPYNDFKMKINKYKKGIKRGSVYLKINYGHSIFSKCKFACIVRRVMIIEIVMLVIILLFVLLGEPISNYEILGYTVGVIVDYVWIVGIASGSVLVVVILKLLKFQINDTEKIIRRLRG